MIRDCKKAIHTYTIRKKGQSKSPFPFYIKTQQNKMTQGIGIPKDSLKLFKTRIDKQTNKTIIEVNIKDLHYLANRVHCDLHNILSGKLKFNLELHNYKTDKRAIFTLNEGYEIMKTLPQGVIEIDKNRVVKHIMKGYVREGKEGEEGDFIDLIITEEWK